VSGWIGRFHFGPIGGGNWRRKKEEASGSFFVLSVPGESRSGPT
jgi:hypothetical protein